MPADDGRHAERHVFQAVGALLHRRDRQEPALVEGDGVVGQCPVIGPGGHFSYNSYHVVARRARVSGAFFGETAAGEWIFTRIPEFRLEVPNWA